MQMRRSARVLLPFDEQIAQTTVITNVATTLGIVFLHKAACTAAWKSSFWTSLAALACELLSAAFLFVTAGGCDRTAP